MTTSADALLLLMWLLSLGSALILGIACARAARRPRNRYAPRYVRAWRWVMTQLLRPWRAWCARRAAKRLRIRVAPANRWGALSSPDTGAVARHAES